MAETGFKNRTSPYAFIWLPVSVSSSGNTTLVTGVSGQQIKLYGVFLMSASSVTISLADGTTNVYTPAAGTTWTLNIPDNPITCQAGNNLVLNLGSSVAVGGAICYFIE